MSVYYNENDSFAAAWLRELMKEGLIPDGLVDERSIKDVEPRDLDGFTQCHFFAGIGGWAHALDLAGWGDSPVWTGSCPCQPFSAAGKRGGVSDARHLWPDFFRLIAQCRPAIVFGEQVSSKDGLAWLDGVRADVESANYAFAALDTCAASAGEEAQGRISYEDNSFRWERIIVGAPHIRQRLYWVADASNPERRSVNGHRENGRDRQNGGRPEAHGVAGTCGEVRRLADADGRIARDGDLQRSGEHGQQPQDDGAGGLGDANIAGSQGWIERRGSSSERAAGAAGMGFWSDFDIIPCLDGKARRIPTGAQSVLLGMVDGLCPRVDGHEANKGHPLAQGVEGRVGALRGFGNAIVPAVAAAFVEAFLASRHEPFA